jgi:ribosomal protein S18 acetylase RimI-like enzyme
MSGASCRGCGRGIRTRDGLWPRLRDHPRRRGAAASRVMHESRRMIEYRRAGPLDAEDVANLHARSWREHYRGSFHDAFLDGDLPAERLRVWRERLDHPPDNQLVQLAHAGAELAGFVCAYGAHDPRWGSFIDNLHVAKAFARSGVGSALMRRAGTWLAFRYPEQGVHLLVLEANAPARRFYELPRGPQRGGLHHGDAWRRAGAELPLRLVTAGAARCCLTHRRRAAVVASCPGRRSSASP